MADRKITALTSLTSPATGDLIPVVDISEAANVNKNKTLTFGQAFRSLPNGSASAPALGWLSDSGVTGLYRVAQNEIGLSVNSSFVAAITAAGFQLGAGTPAAQLHVFGSDTTDQVIIENNDTGGDTAPDVVLYRNSASPAANDNIGNIEFRGKDSGGNTAEYASVRAEIKAATDTAEDGVLDLMTSSAGTVASRVRIDGFNVGIHELDPDYPLHLTTGITSTALQVECTAVDSASGADVTLYHTRNGAASVANDKISTLFYRAKNDNASPADVDYAAIEGSVASPVDGSESGSIQLKTQTAGTLTTQLEISGATIALNGATTFAADASINSLTVGRGGGNIANNSAFGLDALQANTTGESNAATGRTALSSNTTGNNNTATGARALRENTAGIDNTAYGFSSLRFNTVGNNNTATGVNALYNNTTGSGNIGIGFQNSAGVYAPVFDPTTQDNRLVLGHTSITNAYVQVAWTVISDARDKMNFAPVPYGLDFVNQLKPTAYQFKVDRDTEKPNGSVRYGFKAQDILALEGKNPVIIDIEDPDNLKYKGEHLVPVLVNAVQELTTIVKELQAEVVVLKGT